MAAANAFLPSFVARHNLRFARTPARPDDLHRPLELAPDRLRDVLCWRDQRYVGQQLTLTYERKRIMLEKTEVTRGLVGQYVETYAFPDGRLEVRWNGVSLSYRAFDPDQQRVTHAAITENKRLSAVLSAIQEMQEASAPKVTTVGKQRTRYQPQSGPRKPRKSWMDGRAARRAAEATQDVPAPGQAAE